MGDAAIEKLKVAEAANLKQQKIAQQAQVRDLKKDAHEPSKTQQPATKVYQPTLASRQANNHQAGHH
jgi:hypothetical protein